MNDQVRNTQDMLEGAIQFASKPEIVLNPRGTALLASIVIKKTALQTLAASQVAAAADLSAGSTDRALSTAGVLEFVRGMSAIARVLPEETFPGVPDQFRMPRPHTYPVVMATARSFLTKAGPIKATFVEAGMPADFDEQLADALVAFDAASALKHSGRTTRSGSTAGLTATARAAVKLVRQLGSIFAWQFRNDPVRLAEWKTASHIERPLEDEEDTPPPAPGATASTGTGGGEGAATAALLAANNNNGSTAATLVGETPTVVEPRVNGTNGHTTLVG